MPGDRVWKQALMRIFPHTSVDGEQWQRVGYGVTSDNGAAGGTTVISSAWATVADYYNGRYWIEILSGTCKGQWKRVVDTIGAPTYSFTLENNGFSAQIVSSVQFAIWKSPEPVIVADGVADTTHFNDDYRDEDDDFWKDYYVMPINGDARGEIKKVTAFDKTGGATEGLFTTEEFTNTINAGDVILIGKFIEGSFEALPGGPEYIERMTNRVNYARGAGTLGGRSGEFAFKSRAHGSGTLATAGSPANATVLSPLFSPAGLEERIGTSSTVGAGSNTTDVKINTASVENHEIGDLVMHNGHVRRVTGLTDGGVGVDTVTVSPALPLAPASGDVLYAMRTYYKSTDAASLYGCGIEVEIDGIRTIMTGCKGNLELAFTTPVEFAWSFSVDHWTREYEDAPYDPGVAYTTQGDILGKDMMAYADSSQIDVKGLTATVGREVTARNISGQYGVNGRAGFHHTGYACGATYREIMADGAELEAENRYLAETDRALLVQCGTGANCLALSIPVAHHIAAATAENGDGLAEAPNVLGALDAGSSVDEDDVIVKIPDWAIALS